MCCGPRSTKLHLLLKCAPREIVHPRPSDAVQARRGHQCELRDTSYASLARSITELLPPEILAQKVHPQCKVHPAQLHVSKQCPMHDILICAVAQYQPSYIYFLNCASREIVHPRPSDTAQVRRGHACDLRDASYASLAHSITELRPPEILAQKVHPQCKVHPDQLHVSKQCPRHDILMCAVAQNRLSYI